MPQMRYKWAALPALRGFVNSHRLPGLRSLEFASPGSREGNTDSQSPGLTVEISYWRSEGGGEWAAEH